jgi:hypothetical protein
LEVEGGSAPLKSASTWGSQVQPDTQLVFFGVINKILDYLIANAIKHIAVLIFTLWMIRGPPGNSLAGVYPVDFEMKEELLKTWITTQISSKGPAYWGGQSSMA